MPASLLIALLIAQAPAAADSGAHALVQLARGARDSIDQSILEYRAVVRERVALDLRALRRSRRVYRRELAFEVEWRRDGPGRIALLGAREVVIGEPNPRVPRYVRRASRRAVYDPAGDRLFFGPDDTTGVRHPLAAGSETHYRFIAGDTTVLGFPDGRVLRLVELHVVPRRADPRLVQGTLWLETDRHAVVRALLRPARPFDIEIDADAPAGWLLPRIRAEVRLMVLEYALWDQRWWLPRRVAVEAVATAGSWLETPFHYEREYDDYVIQGDSTATLVVRPPPPDSSAKADSATPPYEIQFPDDTASLLVSAALPPPFAGSADASVGGEDVDGLVRELWRARGAPGLWRARPPRALLARYNRVEGLSLGARLELEAGGAAADAVARFGTADHEFEGVVGVEWRGPAARARVAAYRRLAAIEPDTRPLGLGNSLAALLFGRDDGEYFRATGVELVRRAALGRPQNLTLRVYAERQRTVAKETDASLPHLLDSDQIFRPNVAAAPADQVGVEGRIRANRGGVGAALGIDVAGGTFAYRRASLALRAAGRVHGPLAAGIELSGGMSSGVVPAQSAWYLGGAHTLRGYAGGATAGDAYWRLRAELGNAIPGGRVTVFADAGRAGPRETLGRLTPLIGAGAGLSLFDGLVRLDLARATRAPTGWRVELYVDGLL